MGKLGKYTTYVGGSANPAHALLATLYPNCPFAKMLPNGDELAAQQVILDAASADPGADPKGGGIQPKGGVQAGDLGMFPTGVDLTFGGAPDISKIKWSDPSNKGQTAGNPANGYIPDITSPTEGPGHAEGTDKTGDPSATVPQIKAELNQFGGYDNAGQGTADPSTTATAVSKYNTLGQLQTLGQSMNLKAP
jgi:hypothetical protein